MVFGVANVDRLSGVMVKKKEQSFCTPNLSQIRADGTWYILGWERLSAYYIFPKETAVFLYKYKFVFILIIITDN